MSTAFQTATYFDCSDDTERLSHETIEEAISALIDGQPGTPLEAVAAVCPLKVHAFIRTSASGWARLKARQIIDEIAEDWDEEFGDPDGDSDGITVESAKVGEAELEATIEKMLVGTSVFQCEPCGSRVYTAAEVEAMMRGHEPGWFEAKP